MGPFILSISNKMQRYTFYLYLENALHVSGGTSIHHQERIQLYLQHLVFVTPLLLSAAIVEELEPVCILLDIYWNILTMHGPINVKSPNNISKWQMGFNSAFKGFKECGFYIFSINTHSSSCRDENL
jgi:hypothetical protein